MDYTTPAYRDPFRAPGRWYRGNLHMHTTASDGERSPAEAVAWYGAHGYDFCAVTDHRAYTPVDGLSSPGLLVLPGIEAHPGQNEVGEPYHVVAAGGGGARRHGREDAVQGAIDELRAGGAIVWLGHPYWLGSTLAELAALRGYAGIEVYNSTCARFAKGLSTVHWDDLLARGRLVWGLAVDDTHWVGGDWGRGWVMVKAAELTPAAILGALAAGSFYASQGPEIYDVQVTAQEMYVRCSPVASITCVSVSGSGRFAVAEGPDRPLTEATIPRRSARVYLRVECTDAQGRTAWSQPYML